MQPEVTDRTSPKNTFKMFINSDENKERLAKQLSQEGQAQPTSPGNMLSNSSQLNFLIESRPGVEKESSSQTSKDTVKKEQLVTSLGGSGKKLSL